MRIIIDLQGAQTESRYRGIGYYSLSLTKAIVRNKGNHEVIIILNGLFPDTIKSIRSEFNGLLSQESIRVWYTPTHINDSNPDNQWRRETAELIREAFIANLKPDVLHITSLFEGHIDDAVTSIDKFDHITPVSVSLYDLIPLINPDSYLKHDPVYENYYKRKIQHLKRSSLLLAISKSSMQEGVNYLDYETESIINISTAADECFCHVSIDRTQENKLRNRFGLNGSIVLCTGGADDRKNLRYLINAYAKLPIELRNNHQLILAGKMPENYIKRLKQDAKKAGLNSKELVILGYVSRNELVELYNLCKLYVFPSWHEGFGLPALEAMSCGAAVIASNTTSLPEVIGNEDALFDPISENSIKDKIESALTNESFRNSLKQHGLNQAKKFSWDQCASRAISAFEKLHAKQQSNISQKSMQDNKKQKLAFVSPLPPERSGISNYSVELLPYMSRYYDIDVIVEQGTVSDSWIKNNCHIRNVKWFRKHSDEYERVLYQFGNSHYHLYMFDLLRDIPGIVVLHDFFLSGAVGYQETTQDKWENELYVAHGYKAVQERFNATDSSDIVMKYPCNFDVIRNAKGIIVHSNSSIDMMKNWYSSEIARKFTIIPQLMRSPVHDCDRLNARRALKLNQKDFVICSFGILDPTKMNHRILESFLSSDLAKDTKCVLVFVGENHAGEYGQKLLSTIQSSGLKARIHITGWASTETFLHYMAAADLGVQLRNLSRGESSRAVLECMSYSLPTIVNSHGSMADLADDTVYKLPDKFTNEELIKALEILWQDTSYRQQLGSNARERILNHHDPSKCADKYFAAIDHYYYKTQNDKHSLINAIAAVDSHKPASIELVRLAHSIARNMPVQQPLKQLFLDISATHHSDLKTGIERVARAILLEMIEAPPKGYRIEPVYLSDEGNGWHYRYARNYTLELLGSPSGSLHDEEIETCTGDIILGLDLFGDKLVDARPYLDMLHRDGVKIYFTVFDLLPVLMPGYFPPGADVGHANWLRTISSYDGAVCISRSVADELKTWIRQQEIDRPHSFEISWFHLGSDINKSFPTCGMPDDSQKVLSNLNERKSFLIVGTVEPRKGHSQALLAFERLWNDGEDINLVIVGKTGWMVEALTKKISQHPELGKHLFWLEGISDEYLEKVYDSCACLIAASEGEGFGLPIIEASQYGLPVIARDLPVFREIADSNTVYFTNNSPEALADVVKSWLSNSSAQSPVYVAETRIQPTWKESARQILDKVI